MNADAHMAETSQAGDCQLRACRQLSQHRTATRLKAARKFVAVLS
jgi:hypothetical protein